jgi:hypothetical protein
VRDFETDSYSSVFGAFFPGRIPAGASCDVAPGSSQLLGARGWECMQVDELNH